MTISAAQSAAAAPGARSASGVTPLSAAAPARDRCLPVTEELASMLPDGGLRRGHLVGCSGSAAMTLAAALAARAVATGSWMAVVGVPMLGVEAFGELGVPLSRLVRVDAGGGPRVWAERVAAVADGFEVVLTRPPAGSARLVETLRQRLRARGAVLIAVGRAAPGVPCDVEVTADRLDWAGVGEGWGHLAGRRAVVRVGGRRVPRPIERDLWLPGPSGRIEPVGAGMAHLGPDADLDTDDTDDTDESGVPRDLLGDFLDRAG